MPSALFRRIELPLDNPSELAERVKDIAAGFSVSPLACLVRMSSLNMVDRENFAEIKSRWDEEYELYREGRKDADGKNWVPSRNRAGEVMRQYGQIYTRAVVGAYQSREISLHKMCKLLDLKKPSNALALKDFL